MTDVLQSCTFVKYSSYRTKRIEMSDAGGPSRFGWILPGRIAGSGRPGRYGSLEDDLAFLRDEGIRVIISLLETTLNLEDYLREGFEPHHLPVEDFTAPTLEQIAHACAVIEEALGQGKKVLVHCNAGIGLTVSILACFLVHQGREPAEAVAEVRDQRPLSLETREQVEMVRAYYRHRRGNSSK
jgi:atypical dual specificity phosphatase